MDDTAGDFSAPRDDLIRMSLDVGVREEGDGMLLYGYLARFDTPTVINSWEGKFEETIAPGAFRKTIRESRDSIVPLFNHGFDPSIGDKPLGRFSKLAEDDQGLYYEVPLSRTSYNEDIAALVRDKAIPGNSFRFSVVKEAWEQPGKRGGLPKRTLQEVRLMEGGPVTFPAYKATTVGIRSRQDFQSWQGLDDAKREQVRSLIFDTRTEEPPEGTPDERAVSNTSQEPDRAATPRVSKTQLGIALSLRSIA